MTLRPIAASVSVACIALACGSAFAQTPTAAAATAAAPTTSAPTDAAAVERLRTTLAVLIKTLVDQRTLTPEKAAELLRASGIDPATVLGGAAPSASAEATTGKPTIRVPFVPPGVYQQLREDIERDVLAKAKAEGFAKPGEVPEWISRITLYGDVRVRAQRDSFGTDNDNPILVDAFFQLPDGTTNNTTEDRNRLRVRARLGLTARVASTVDADLRVVTSSGGDANNPVSTNIDTGRFNRRYGAAFDLAYIRWTPTDDTALVGGRISNPYQTTDLIWAPDLTLDGLAATWKPRLSESWTGLATIGVHPLREVEAGAFNRAQDKWLYGAQLGLRWRGDDHRFNVATTYYDFDKIEGQLNPANPIDNTFLNESAPLVRQRGNTMFNIAYRSSATARVFGLASKFKLAVLGGGYEFTRFDPIRLSVTGEYVLNTGFDRNEILRRIGPAVADLPFDVTGQNGVTRKRNRGYRYALQVGNPDLDGFGRWQAYAGYRYLERDAVPDAFTSADYRLGGTDQKATFFGVNFGLERNTALGLRYITAKNIDNATRFSVDSLFVDVESRF